MSADGTTSASLARYTPVPGTRATPSSSVSTLPMGIAISANADFNSARPVRHVQNTTNRHAASVSGIHPPSGTLVRLPMRKLASMSPSSPNSSTTKGFGQFQCVHATYAPSTVVIDIVPMTAVPYAADNASELWNVSTKLTTATNRIAFTAGT